MNNITQVKRGTTASWSLGPERVHWENLEVWGKDSIIHCEGTHLKMNVYTSSANYFYDENGQLEDFKRPGLWLIQPGEINWSSTTSQAVFRCGVSGPSDCWIEVYSELSEELRGQKIYLNSQPIEMTIPYHGKWGLYMRWPEERTSLGIANVKLSIREVGAYEELEPGQLGVEYTEYGEVKLKAGKPGVYKWNLLPYIAGKEPGFGEVPVGKNLLAANDKVQFARNPEYGGHVSAKVRPLELIAGNQYYVKFLGALNAYEGWTTAKLDDDGVVALEEFYYSYEGEYERVYHIKTTGVITLGGYKIDSAPGYTSFGEGMYTVSITPKDVPQIQTIDPKYLPLPNPEDAEFEGASLVVKNGQWVFTDAPVVTMGDVSSIVTNHNNKFNQIEEELARLRALVEGAPTE